MDAASVTIYIFQQAFFYPCNGSCARARGCGSSLSCPARRWTQPLCKDGVSMQQQQQWQQQGAAAAHLGAEHNTELPLGLLQLYLGSNQMTEASAK